MPEEPRNFSFPEIRDHLEDLMRATENLLDRDVPGRFPQHLDAVQFLLSSFRLARHTFDAMRYLCANQVTEPGESLPRPEYGLVVPPLTRYLLDTAMTYLFLLEEDIRGRWEWFMRAGWREMKLETQRVETDFGSLPNWREWLQVQYQPLLAMAHMMGIPDREVSSPETITRWPNPGGMARYGLGPTDRLPAARRFLGRLNDVLYIDASQQSHPSFIGTIKRAGHLTEESLRDDSDARRERLRGYVSDQVFAAITLMLVVISILDERFQLGLEGRIRPLWAIIGDYWDPAKLLLEVRYEAPLFGVSAAAQNGPLEPSRG